MTKEELLKNARKKPTVSKKKEPTKSSSPRKTTKKKLTVAKKSDEIAETFSKDPNEIFFRWDDALHKSPNAKYYMAMGERSNGKTFASLEIGLFGYHQDGIEINGYLDDGSQLGIIRRWEEDFKGKNGAQQFDNFVHNEIEGNIIEKRTNGKWNGVFYFSSRWYLCHYDGEGKRDKTDSTPCAFAFALGTGEHAKSSSYPHVRNILFDEWITRGHYLVDEFILFSNILSTIIRRRDDVRIFMCANTISKYDCPYFVEMGLTNARKMKAGEIDLYKYGESKLEVVLQYTDPPEGEIKSNVYFAFDNAKLDMIKKGSWEFSNYPHLPVKYKPKDIEYIFLIEFLDEIYQCEIIAIDDSLFVYIHRKTTPIKDDPDTLVYSQDYSIAPNYRRKISKPQSKLEKTILSFFVNDKVYYQDNEVGEAIRGYLRWQASI